MLLPHHLWSYSRRINHHGMGVPRICSEACAKYPLWNCCFPFKRIANQLSLRHMQSDQLIPDDDCLLALPFPVSGALKRLAIPNCDNFRLFLLLQLAADNKTNADPEHLNGDGSHHRHRNNFNNELRRSEQLYRLPHHHPKHPCPYQNLISR